jgi:hypothetical protein
LNRSGVEDSFHRVLLLTVGVWTAYAVQLFSMISCPLALILGGRDGHQLVLGFLLIAASCAVLARGLAVFISSKNATRSLNSSSAQSA